MYSCCYSSYEDHAKRADIPVRFAASKIIEGDPLILKLLQLDENEKEMLEHIVLRWRLREVLTEARQLQYEIYIYREDMRS